MASQVIYKSGGIFISTTLLRFGGVTYSTAHINSVSIERRKIFWYVIFGIGLTLMAIGTFYAAFHPDTAPQGLSTITQQSDDSGALFGSGLVVTVLALVCWVNVFKPQHYLIVRMSSGQRHAIESRDVDYLQNLQNGVERAVDERG